MTQIRDLKELNPLVDFLARKALEDIRRQGVNPLVVETYRSQARQNKLYAQGRTAPGNKVTWTRNSKHTTRKALDVVPQRSVGGSMKAIWNAKDKDFVIIINTMIAYGFEAGHNWKNNIDSAHFQIDGNFTTSFRKECTTREITKMIQAKVNTKVDGSWGKDTEASVKTFQKLNGLTADGHVGLKTLGAMFCKEQKAVNSKVEGTYRIEEGDTLSKIAYNNGTTVDSLVEINNIKNPNLIRVGQLIKLGASSNKTLKVGSKVKVKQGAKDYNNKSLASFVYKQIYEVIQIDKERVVIGKGKTVTAAVNKKDLMIL